MAQILVIDDYPEILTVIGLMLTLAGHEVITARDGPTGLQVAEDTLPDLVLMDFDMPGWDGLRVCGELKRNPATVRIPVLLMTGRISLSFINQAGEAGAIGVLSKPLDRRRLLAEVARGLKEAVVA